MEESGDSDGVFIIYISPYELLVNCEIGETNIDNYSYASISLLRLVVLHLKFKKVRNILQILDLERNSYEVHCVDWYLLHLISLKFEGIL